MNDTNDDLLAKYDEKELIELTESDGNGGTTLACGTWAIATLVSSAFCPTTKCTSKC